MKNLGIRQLLLGLALCIASLDTIMSAQGQTGVLVADYPTSYVVQDDDTLWNIASQFLRDPQRWPDI
jgi:nucleoid-associated protein YgaU